MSGEPMSPIVDYHVDALSLALQPPTLFFCFESDVTGQEGGAQSEGSHALKHPEAWLPALSSISA